MLSLMLNLRFKSFCPISSFVGQKEGVSIVDEYDRIILYPMFLKCYHHLHPTTESVGCINQTSDEDFNLDFFNRLHPQMSHQRDLPPRNYRSSDVTKWIPKTSSVLFNGGENMKPCFVQLVFWLVKS